MEQVDNYDYSPSLPFIDEFENPFKNVPFIEEMEENYGKLWQFKNCVRFWTLGVSRFKNYVYLLHRESNRGNFLPLNLNEKVKASTRSMLLSRSRPSIATAQTRSISTPLS